MAQSRNNGGLSRRVGGKWGKRKQQDKPGDGGKGNVAVCDRGGPEDE